MDDLDRVFHRLVSNIRHRHSEYLTLPFTVQELYETLIPYRHHRRELGIETNQDYEIAVTRLLSGERDYLLADQSMHFLGDYPVRRMPLWCCSQLDEVHGFTRVHLHDIPKSVRQRDGV